MDDTRPIVTILTDFGTQDSYVAEMKGVLLSARRDVTLVDITHAVPPQDVEHGAYVLGTTYACYPSDTVHLGVVDPGVGTDRRAIVVDHDGGRFVGPDNGLFSAVLTDKGLRSVHEIQVTEVVSRTFHGRDVFAPSVARLVLGETPSELGPEISDAVTIDRWQPDIGDREAVGRIVHIDRFGNAITNLQETDFGGRRSVRQLRVRDVRVDAISETYGDVEAGEVVALIGSQGTLEVSVNGGDAARTLGLARGTTVTVSLEDARS